MKKNFFLLTLLIFSFRVFSQTPTLLKDLTPSNPSTRFGQNGTNQSGIIVNNNLFTIIENALWISDGTPFGTNVLKNDFQNQLLGLTKAGNIVFFSELISSTVSKLWKSDGTINGTVEVANISAPIYSAVEMNGILYFVAQYGSISELWRSDGTISGTYLLKTINIYGGDYTILKVMGNTLFFQASETSTGLELWKTDGTVANTQIVKDIFQGNGSSSPSNFASMNGILYFRAENGPNNRELWRSDGTDVGTYLLKDIVNGSSYPSVLEVVDNKLIFSAYDNNGLELWVSDGTTNGTLLLKDIFPGNQSGYLERYINRQSIHGSVLFIANDGINGYSLWKTDGTANGTVMVKDIISGNNTDQNAFNIFIYGTQNKVYFSVINNLNYDDLWQTDGTENGTFKVNSLNSNLEFYLKNSSLMSSNPSGNNFYFTAYDKEAGVELWKTDGTPNGLLKVKDITIGGNQPSYVQNLRSINGHTFFTADNIINGNELWRTDGTTANTELFKDFTIGYEYSGNTFFGFMTKFKNELYIQTNYGKIWRTDGSQISLFKSFPITTNVQSYPSIVIGDNLFFANFDYINGNFTGFELFKTDGVNTTLVKNINPVNFAESLPENFCNLNGTLYFSANDGTNGRELWKSDGTETGTVLVKNITSGANSTNFNEIISANGLIFFMTDNYSKLWRSDGSDSGTFLLHDAGTNNMGNGANAMINFNNKVFFKGFEVGNDGELWESDGTIAGTKLTKNINPNFGSYPAAFVEFEGLLYFAADSQLWKSDGTNNGTVLVSSALSPYSLYSTDGTLYINAWSNNQGNELWESDGTTIGTTLVADLNPGSNSSNPNTLHLSDNGKLFFVANNGISGEELFVRTACTPNFNLTSTENYPNGTALKKEAKNFISATNKVENGAKIKYDAGKYVVLNAGFEAKQGSVFKAYIDGCTTDEPNSAATNSLNFNANNAVDLTKNYPSLNDFLSLPENSAIKTAYLIAKNEKDNYETNKLTESKNLQLKPASAPTSPTYYIIETGKKNGLTEYILKMKIGEIEFSSTLQK